MERYISTVQKEGRKLDNIVNNPKVYFEVDDFLGIKKGEKPCNFSTYYRSVIVFGDARLIEKLEEKKEVLKRFMRKHSAGTDDSVFDEIDVVKVTAIEVRPKKITGKQHLR